MNIYLVSQEKNRGSDTFDSFVVVCESIEEAKMTYPGYLSPGKVWDGKETYTWCDSDFVKVEFIGTTEKYSENTILCASFNAG